jgi:hypothetical protein
MIKRNRLAEALSCLGTASLLAALLCQDWIDRKAAYLWMAISLPLLVPMAFVIKRWFGWLYVFGCIAFFGGVLIYVISN